MPMFNNGETYNPGLLIKYLKSHWNLTATEVTGDDKSMAFKVDGELVALATVGVQIPWTDIQSAARAAYNWPSAEKELENHNSHVLVTVMSATKSAMERFAILTKILSSILATTDCIGVYNGSPSVLIPKNQYLDSADVLKQNDIPVDLWIYIGFAKTESGNNVYTYGLQAFDKPEMEFINCREDITQMLTFLINVCSYVIKSNVRFRSGETVGFTAEQKIKITLSKGIYVPGQTLKLEL